MTWGQFSKFTSLLPEDDQPQPVQPAPWVLWVWRAWWRLDHDRPWIGGGFAEPVPGRITFQSIDAYARRHGIAGDQFAMFDQLIGAMDVVFLEWSAERAKQRAQAQKNKR